MTAIDSYSHDVSGEKEFGFAQAINGIGEQRNSRWRQTIAEHSA